MDFDSRSWWIGLAMQISTSKDTIRKSFTRDVFCVEPRKLCLQCCNVFEHTMAFLKDVSECKGRLMFLKALCFSAAVKNLCMYMSTYWRCCTLSLLVVLQIPTPFHLAIYAIKMGSIEELLVG